MRALIFDPFAGISGDMLLGALVDLGLPAAWLTDFVHALGLPGVDVAVERAVRRGIDCGRVRFILPHEHHHRHLSDVLGIVDGRGAPARVRERASAVFRRLAAAEAAIHGIDIERVHFHEVGALDAILDVLCACGAVDELGYERFHTRPVALGSGWIDIAHGRFPVPAPATLKLLEGLPTTETSLEGECTTPTGAAILGTLVGDTPAPPGSFVVEGSGYGAGTRDPADRPNCLRVIACTVDEVATEALYVLQADVDDLPPEYVPAAQDTLLAAGALDAVVHGVAMKKGRPGLRIEALVPEAATDAVLRALFRSTTTIGARFWPVSRPALPRREESVEWRGERLRRKCVRLPDGSERTKLEYEDVARVARSLDRPVYEVRLEIERETGSGGRSE